MNTEAVLPRLCCRCHKQKAAQLVTRFKSKTRFSSFYYVCHSCLETPAILRGVRRNNESYPERKVRLALQEAKIFAKAEYPLGGFIYDFAVPNLRLLIEVDSRRYHRSLRQVKRDRQKDAYAREAECKLVRIKAGDEVGNRAVEAVFERRRELGI